MERTVPTVDAGLHCHNRPVFIAAVEIAPTGVEELIDTSRVTGLDVLWAVVTIGAGVLLAGVARRVARRGLARVEHLPDNLVQLIVKSTGWSIIVLALVFALPFLGIEIGPIVVVILLVVAVVVLSGRGFLENMGAGIILQAESAFSPGDQISTNDCVGLVREVSSRAVDIQAIDGRRVVVPNSKVLTEPLVVFTANSERRSELIVGLEYGTDLDTARRVLLAATQHADGVLASPPVDVFASVFGDSSIDFFVWYWHAPDIRTAYVVTDAVVRSIDRACKEHGLTIAFPQRTLWWGEPPPSVS